MESLSKHSAVTQRTLRYFVACLLAGLAASSVLACASDDTNDDKQSSAAESKTSEQDSKDAGKDSKDTDAASTVGAFMPPKPSEEQEASSLEQMRFDGDWHGTTSQDKPVSVKILNRFLAHIEITYALEGDGCKSDDRTVKVSAMVGLRNAAFTLMNTTPTEMLTATGMFSDDPESSGMFTVVAAGDLPKGCDANVSGTWKATK